jgi:hypothetical protein
MTVADSCDRDDLGDAETGELSEALAPENKSPARRTAARRLFALVTGPGTAPTARPSSCARRATVIDPERAPASTTTVAAESAAISRARAMKRWRVGTAPGWNLTDHEAEVGHSRSSSSR